MSDYWTDETASPAGDDPHAKGEERFDIRDVCPVFPLDVQMGINPKKTVPDGLSDALFAQPDPSASDIKKYGTSGDIPQLKLYVVIDAAKVLGLPEILMETGLHYECLFQGAAVGDLADVAPYLVELREGETFTRNLFTQSDADWHLWEDEVGIFIRSYATLDVLRAHLRKYTRIQDLTGKWFFFRFWEGAYLDEVLRSSDQAMNAGFFNELHSFGYIFRTVIDDWCFRELHSVLPDSQARKCFILDEQMEQAMKRVNCRLRAEQSAARLEIPVSEKTGFVSLAQRHYMIGYDDEQKIKISYGLFKKIPQEQHDAVWVVLEKGNDSLGFTHHRIKEHFGIEE